MLELRFGGLIMRAMHDLASVAPVPTVAPVAPVAPVARVARVSRPVLRHIVAIAACSAALAASPLSAQAQTRPAPTTPAPAQTRPAPLAQAAPLTLSAALARDADAHPGLRAALARGASLEAPHVISLLSPTRGQRALVELLLRYRGASLRAPVVMARSPSGWSLRWAPTPEYFEALLTLTASDALVQAPAPPWIDSARLPALPILLTRQRAITPFGAISSPQPQPESLSPWPELSHAIARWLKEVGHDDPSLAAIDLIASQDVSWLSVQRVALSAARAGMFRITLVTRVGTGQALGGLIVNAPVLDHKSRHPNLIVAYTPSEAPGAFRLRLGGDPLRAQDACTPQVSLCVSQPDALPQALRELLPAHPHHALFATTGDITLGDAARWLAYISQAAGIPPSRLFIGLIQR